MKDAGCTKVAIANDKEAYGSGLATLLELEKGDYGVNIVSNTGIDPTAPNFRSYAARSPGQGADCFYFAGIVSNGAVQITKDVTRRCPRPRSSALTASARTRTQPKSKGGVPATIDPLMECTVATQDLAAYPGGKHSSPRTRPSTARPSPTRTRSTAMR